MKSIKDLYEKSREQLKPEYFSKNGFRYVKPYKYTFQTYAKQRWLHRSIIDVFTNEFVANSEQYYKDSIQNGNIKVNNQQVDKDYILKQNDLIVHESFRKEPPVLDQKVQVVYEDDDLLVVNKPASVPCHEGGSHYFNTLFQILNYEMGYAKLYSMHRLDKLTSGIIMLAKKPELVSIFHEEHDQPDKIQKSYLARVQGKFDTLEILIDKPIYCISVKSGQYGCCSQEEMISKKAKKAQTKFKLVWYNQETDTSLVECSPITGKTHQIRVHLTDINHPIINDVNYGGKFIGNLWVTTQFTALEEKIIENRIQNNSEQSSIKQTEQIKSIIQDNCAAETGKSEIEKSILEDFQTKENPPKQKNNENNNENNDNNKNKSNVNNYLLDKRLKKTILKKEKKKAKFDEKFIKQNKNEQKPKENEECDKYNLDQWDLNRVFEIYLHSSKYKFQGKTFEAEKPYWAHDDFIW